MKETLVGWVKKGDYTTQFNIWDSSKPLKGSLLTNQDFMECHKGLVHAAHMSNLVGSLGILPPNLEGNVP